MVHKLNFCKQQHKRAYHHLQPKRTVHPSIAHHPIYMYTTRRTNASLTWCELIRKKNQIRAIVAFPLIKLLACTRRPNIISDWRQFSQIEFGNQRKQKKTSCCALSLGRAKKWCRSVSTDSKSKGAIMLIGSTYILRDNVRFCWCLRGFNLFVCTPQEIEYRFNSIGYVFCFFMCVCCFKLIRDFLSNDRKYFILSV